MGLPSGRFGMSTHRAVERAGRDRPRELIPARTAALGRSEQMDGASGIIPAARGDRRGLVRIDGDAAAQASVIEQLRASHLFGNIVIVRGSAALRAG